MGHGRYLLSAGGGNAIPSQGGGPEIWDAPVQVRGCTPEGRRGGLAVALQPGSDVAALQRHVVAGSWAAEPESTRSKSGALADRACSARSTTRSMFCLGLPAPPLT